MASFECPGCGNFVQDSEKYCPYCGNPNPNYVEPTRAAPVNHTPTVPTNVTNNAPVPTQTNNSNNNAGSSSNNNTRTNARPSTTNWFVFILLLFIFWPAAVIYLIVTNR